MSVPSRLSSCTAQHGIIALDLDSKLLVARSEVMMKRDSWGHSYLTVRGEILGFVKDGLLRKHLPWMFSLIKNES